MTQPLKITDYHPPAAHSGGGVGVREIGTPGWQLAWQRQLVRSGGWSRLTGGQMAVLIALIAHADQDGRCWPSVATLASLAGQKQRATQTALRRFQALRLLGIRQADDAIPRRHFQFFRWSEWALDDQVMASDGDAPAPPEVPPGSFLPRAGSVSDGPPATAPDHRTPARGFQAHAGAPQAHADAPQAHIRAPEAHAGAPPSIYGKGEEYTSSSKALVPGAQRQAGLFDDDVVASLLCQKGFPPRRAASMVAQFGRDRIREAITHCDFLAAKGEIRKSYHGAMVRFLEQDFAVDSRIEREAHAERRREQARQQATASIATESPSGSPLTGDARDLVAKANGLLVTRRDASWPDCLAHARARLNWPDCRWEAALRAVEDARRESNPQP